MTAIYALASTTASILRGTTTQRFVASLSQVAIASGVPVDIAVTNTNAYDPTSQQIRTIRTISGSIQSDTDITESDRLRDDATGVVYIVEQVTQRMGPGFVGDLELVLKQVA